MRQFSRPRLLVGALLLLGACGSNAAPVSSGAALAVAEPAGCGLTDGTSAANGAIAPSVDGANTCTCRSASWSCTELPFHTAPPPTTASGPAMAVYDSGERCTLSDGTVAVVGASARSDDGCNTCQCATTGWACTDMACP